MRQKLNFKKKMQTFYEFLEINRQSNSGIFLKNTILIEKFKEKLK